MKFVFIFALLIWNFSLIYLGINLKAVHVVGRRRDRCLSNLRRPSGICLYHKKNAFTMFSVYISCSVSNRVYNNAYTQLLYLILWRASFRLQNLLWITLQKPEWGMLPKQHPAERPLRPLVSAIDGSDLNRATDGSDLYATGKLPCSVLEYPCVYSWLPLTSIFADGESCNTSGIRFWKPTPAETAPSTCEKTFVWREATPE